MRYIMVSLEEWNANLKQLIRLRECLQSLAVDCYAAGSESQSNFFNQLIGRLTSVIDWMKEVYENGIVESIVEATLKRK